MVEQAEQIVDVLAAVAPDGGAALARRAGPQALAHAQAIRGEIVPRLEDNALTVNVWQGFQQAPQVNAPLLTNAVQLLLSADAALARRLDVLLAQYRQAKGDATAINTGGGAYVGGNITVSGGDFVGRDSVQITGDGNIVGDHSSSTVIKRMGMEVNEVAALFEQAMNLARRQPPAVREELEAAVETAQEETEAGEGADKRLLNKALDVLLEEGPDILEIVLDAILNPAAAAGKGARMLAKQAKKSLAKQRKQK